MAGGGVNRLTTRDYKKNSRRPMDLGRYREFGIGLLVGVVLASGLFIYKSDAKKVAVPESPRPEPQRAAKAESDAAAPGSEGHERYDFYEMLPNFEVVVPEKDRDVKRDLPAARIERPGVYVLQAGSYRNLPDAERVRAQLALQGIDAKVQRVAVDNDVWHRVRIGPINDLAELNRVRKQLQAAEVDGLVIRVGD
jgi:cell division protein FtsN